MEEGLKTKLTELGLNEEQNGKLEAEGVKTEADIALLSDKDIKDITACGIVVAKKVAAAFVPEEKTVLAEVASTRIVGADILPQVPDDESFLNALKTTGILKGGITPVDVQSACKALVADRVDFFNLPGKILDEMERVAMKTKKPYSESYYELETLVARRTYAEVLKVLKVDSRYVTQSRMKAFLAAAPSVLWPALRGFQTQCEAWRESYNDTSLNPRTLIATMQGKNVAEIPDTGPLHDEAEAVIDRINEVFAGPGIPVARALAFDATNIKQVLLDERLPSAVGAVDYESMIELLGATVAANVIRQELNIVKFTLAIMNFKAVTPGDAEVDYILAMYQVGKTIPWDQLVGASVDRRETGRGKKEGTPDQADRFRGSRETF